MKLKYIKATVVGFVLTLSVVVHSIISAQTYIVKAGDTLSELAIQLSTTVDTLVVKNNIKDANLIYIGQVLEVVSTSLQETEVPVEVIEEEVVETTETTEAPTEQVVEAPVETPAPVVEEPQTPAPTPAAPSSTLSASEAAAKEEIAQRESGGSYTARNGQYYGRYQLTESYLNGDLSPENQERVADAYVAARYGSWVAALAFWNANGWY